MQRSPVTLDYRTHRGQSDLRFEEWAGTGIGALIGLHIGLIAAFVTEALPPKKWVSDLDVLAAVVMISICASGTLLGFTIARFRRVRRPHGRK